MYKELALVQKNLALLIANAEVGLNANIEVVLLITTTALHHNITGRVMGELLVLACPCAKLATN